MTVSCHPFKVHSFDTDAFGLLSAPGLLGYLLESSGRSADRLGFGIAKLQKERGLTWVIGRIKIELVKPLRFLENLEVQTWPSGLARSAVMRDFRILKSNLEVGRATSTWFLLDMDTRLPVRAHEVFPSHLHPEQEHLVPLSRLVPRFHEPEEVAHQFSVRFSDIDLNRHVTAASYVAWAMEAVDERTWETQRLASLDIQFLEECHLGETVISSSRRLDATTRLHRITRHSNGQEITRVMTTFTARETDDCP
jgi:medium-chain acyl-[acyl-carrier-protein] hydrolase